MESASIIDYLNLSGLYPEWDEFSLLVCDICGTIIRPLAFEKHLKTKHHIGVQANNNNHPQQQQPQHTTTTTTTILPNNKEPHTNHHQPNQPLQPQKITFNPPPPTLDRKRIITTTTSITNSIPSIKPTTITTTAIKTTTNVNCNGNNHHNHQSNQPLQTQKITINAPLPTIDRKRIITTTTSISNSIPSIKPPTTITTNAIKPTTNGNGNCNGNAHHNLHLDIISLPMNGSTNHHHHVPPPAFLSKFEDRKWKNTKKALKDAFF